MKRILKSCKNITETRSVYLSYDKEFKNRCTRELRFVTVITVVLEPVLQQKISTFLLTAADAKGVTMLVVEALLVFILYVFKEKEANCQARGEKASRVDKPCFSGT